MYTFPAPPRRSCMDRVEAVATVRLLFFPTPIVRQHSLPRRRHILFSSLICVYVIVMPSPEKKKKYARRRNNLALTMSVTRTNSTNENRKSFHVFPQNTDTFIFLYCFASSLNIFLRLLCFVWRINEMWIFPFFSRLRLPLSEKQSLVICSAARNGEWKCWRHIIQEDCSGECAAKI